MAEYDMLLPVLYFIKIRDSLKIIIKQVSVIEADVVIAPYEMLVSVQPRQRTAGNAVVIISHISHYIDSIVSGDCIVPVFYEGFVHFGN